MGVASSLLSPRFYALGHSAGGSFVLFLQNRFPTLFEAFVSVEATPGGEVLSHDQQPQGVLENLRPTMLVWNRHDPYLKEDWDSWKQWTVEDLLNHDVSRPDQVRQLKPPSEANLRPPRAPMGGRWVLVDAEVEYWERGVKNKSPPVCGLFVQTNYEGIFNHWPLSQHVPPSLPYGAHAMMPGTEAWVRDFLLSGRC